jgi:hypothetical protein
VAQSSVRRARRDDTRTRNTRRRDRARARARENAIDRARGRVVTRQLRASAGSAAASRRNRAPPPPPPLWRGDQSSSAHRQFVPSELWLKRGTQDMCHTSYLYI